MQEVTTQVNWLAAVVGAVTAFVAGSLWYSPWVFGRRWAEGLGFSLEGKPPLEPMLAQIAGLGLLSLFVAVAGTSPMIVLLGLAAFVILAYSGESFARHPIDVRLINAGYLLLAAHIMLLTQTVI